MRERYEKVRKYYEMGIWGENKVRDAVIHGWITAEEYELITGVEYESRG